MAPRTRGTSDPPAAPVVAASEKSSARPILKRAASLASLPTPPRTATKRKRRARSRVTDSDTEDDRLPELSDDEDHGAPHASDSHRDTKGAVVLGNKKRKTLDTIAEELSEAVVEESFWMGASADEGKDKAEVGGEAGSSRGERGRERTRSPSSSPPPAPHLLQRNRTGLVSPPPSRRQPVRACRLKTPSPAAVLTTQSRGRLFPARDSPNNPFLSEGGSVTATPSTPVAGTSASPRTPKRPAEKPTLTWVFRGKKVELANPHYHSPSEAHDAEIRASLPEEHPDYSPLPTYAPKLLFPEARKRTRGGVRKVEPPGTPTPTTPRLRRTPARVAKAPAAPPPVDSDDEVDRAAAPEDGPSEEEPDWEDTSMAVQAAMADRLARRVKAFESFPIGGPRTRTRAPGAPPRVPAKDGDAMRRAVGPICNTRGSKA